MIFVLVICRVRQNSQWRLNLVDSVNINIIPVLINASVTQLIKSDPIMSQITVVMAIIALYLYPRYLGTALVGRVYMQLDTCISCFDGEKKIRQYCKDRRRRDYNTSSPRIICYDSNLTPLRPPLLSISVRTTVLHLCVQGLGVLGLVRAQI